jgi:hypothetical protein
MARCERVRATAVGSTREEAIENLQEAIIELVREYGEDAVFQDVPPGTDMEVIEVAVWADFRSCIGASLKNFWKPSRVPDHWDFGIINGLGSPVKVDLL